MAITLTWTKTDESPRLAAEVLLPIVSRYLATAGISVTVADISLAGRILAAQGKAEDALTQLGELAKSGQANIVKTPNISASIGQIKACIDELNAQGEALPAYPINPTTDAEQACLNAYDQVKGSAVNPVLREGNSDRRAPVAVKAQAQANPHWMGEWSPQSKTRVLTMDEGDFRHTETSITTTKETTVSIVFIHRDGEEHILKPALPLEAGEILDGACLRASALERFLAKAYTQAKADPDVVLGAHLKATMMKVSDPVIFGRVISAWMTPLIITHASVAARAGWTTEQGLGALANAIGDHGQDLVNTALQASPAIAMADATSGLSTLHAPNTTIIDASMPAMIRAGGKMAGADGQLHDTIAVIPDSSYADLYQVIIDDCKANGAYDPATMGTVPNVGLMAKKAEEYGSHDKTFIINGPGQVEVRDQDGQVLLSHEVMPGDIWRACQTKDAPIRDWVRLAIRRAKETGWPAVFWLDQTRPHDAELLKVVSDELDQHDLTGADIHIMDIAKATAFTIQRIRKGEHTISVSGNVMRDYLTDMFPIIELGTSSRMLSIVPLMAGGGLYETGAGGTAPLLVQQVLDENHFQWDSLGEYMALVPALEQIASDHNLPGAKVLANTLDTAILGYLQGGHTPQAEVGQNDTRTAGYWIARLWARALADQSDDTALASRFAPLAKALEDDEDLIIQELKSGEGNPSNLGGYYRPDEAKLAALMRPSARFNHLIDHLV